MSMNNKSCRPEDWIEQLITKHEHRLYRTALAVLGCREDAEDALQEVFIKTFQNPPDFQSEDHEKSWLIRVTVNQCRSMLRSLWHKLRSPLPESLLAEYPAQSASEQELLENVMELPWKYRVVIHLFYYEGYSIREISRLTGQRESTVRSLLTRGRQKLRKFLEKGQEES